MTTAPGQGRPAAGLELVHVFEGAAFGINQPVLQCSLRPPASFDPARALPALAALVERDVPGVDAKVSPALQFTAAALWLAVEVQRQAGVPVMSQGRILRATGEGFLLALPCVPQHSRESFAALAWSVSSLVTLGCDGQDHVDVAKEHKALLERLGKAVPTAGLIRFVGAARAADIPWDWKAGPFFQFGWGARQSSFFSTILQTTTSMGVTLARNKQWCSQALRRAGLPVPDHALVSSLEEAKAAAARIGYPVVIKPPNLDGGLGVAAGLATESQLEQAWPATFELAKEVLVERHVPGNDFRMIVMDGKLVWAVGRQEAGVRGDGRRTVEELVAAANEDPRRGFHALATLRPIELNAESVALMQEQGLAAGDIPADGRWVRLRRAANISSGGLPVLVTDQVHPDNRALMERAAAVIRLDLAGIDFLTPDITQSWREVGGAIVEINAQPQLVVSSQSHLFGAILASRVPGNGRIPVVLIAARGDAGHEIGTAVRAKLAGAGRKFGLATANGAWIDDEPVSRAGLSPFAAGRALLMLPETQGLLLVADDSIASTGLPFDRCDLFVVHEAADCADAQRRSNDVLLGVAARHARIVMTRTPRLRAAWTPTFPDVALAPDEPPADVEGLARMLADWFRGNMRA